MFSLSLRRSTALGGVGMAAVLCAASASALPPHASRAASAAALAPAAPAAQTGEVPRFTVVTHRPGTSPGLLFATPQSARDSGAVHGPQILDDRGRVVWFRPLPAGQFATDLRVQRYRGKPVLTWWQGTSSNTGIGKGVGYIADSSYRVIATVRPDGDYAPDLHEFALTEKGTALVTSYRTVPYDLTPVGGPKDGQAVDSVVEEIDVATGRRIMRWSSLQHVPITESDMPVELTHGAPYDYFHVNSVAVDDDGDLLVSGRTTSTVYKVDRQTGAVLWRLGGRHSSFRLGAGVRFNWQHDAMPEGRGTYRIFDNGSVAGSPGWESRVVRVRVDARRRTATYLGQVTHPVLQSVENEGGSQRTPGGGTLVSWGSSSRISEFAKSGRLLFDATLPAGWSSYRVYRLRWSAEPAAPPAVSVGPDGALHASWNGATGVARWRVLGGDAPAALKPVAEAAWQGLDTAVRLDPLPRFVKVEALDAHGTSMGSSAAVPTDS
ncbi:arylsulfotransferase family protein [Actinomadura geliboluensis]